MCRRQEVSVKEITIIIHALESVTHAHFHKMTPVTKVGVMTSNGLFLNWGDTILTPVRYASQIHGPNWIAERPDQLEWVLYGPECVCYFGI